MWIQNCNAKILFVGTLGGTMKFLKVALTVLLAYAPYCAADELYPGEQELLQRYRKCSDEEIALSKHRGVLAMNGGAPFENAKRLAQAKANECQAIYAEHKRKALSAQANPSRGSDLPNIDYSKSKPATASPGASPGGAGATAVTKESPSNPNTNKKTPLECGSCLQCRLGPHPNRPGVQWALICDNSCPAEVAVQVCYGDDCGSSSVKRGTGILRAYSNWDKPQPTSYGAICK